MNERRYLCLYDIPIFSGMDKTKFSLICHASKKYCKKKGEFLFRQGDITNAIYLIKKGSFKLVRITENGEEVIIQIVGQGQIIGETNLFRENTISPISAIALEEVKICSIDIQSLEKAINNEPKIALYIIKNLGKRYYDALEHIVELNTQTVQEKVLSLFIRLAQEYGESCTEGTIIKIYLTQEEIASIVGASRVMVSQTLKELIKIGYICRKKKYYMLKGKCF